MNRTKQLFGVFADILACVGFILAVVLACHVFPNNEATGFDYQAVLVGVIGAIFTLLVGWNIFQALDWRDKFEKIDRLQASFRESQDIIFKNSEYNQAVTHAMIGEHYVAQFLDKSKEDSKFLMVNHCLLALELMSKQEGYEGNMFKITQLLIDALIASSEIKLTEQDRVELAMLCGRIHRKDRIPDFDKVVELILNIKVHENI